MIFTAQLLRSPNTFTPEQLQDLLKIKQSLGYVDPRYGLKECELCDNAEWRPGVTCQVPPQEGGGPGYDPDAAVSLWQKMGSMGGSAPPEFLSTHPAPGNREAELAAMIPEMRKLNPTGKLARVTAIEIVRDAPAP